MAKPPGANFLPSLLDRLIDDAPEVERDLVKSRVQQLADLRNAVRRDLEALLNSHRRCISSPPGLDELEVSVVGYGVPDFMASFGDGAAFKEAFRASIERAIKLYEPRFVSVDVKLLDDEKGGGRTLNLRIEALMFAEPAPEPITFDSRIDPATQSYSVIGLDHD